MRRLTGSNVKGKRKKGKSRRRTKRESEKKLLLKRSKEKKPPKAKWLMSPRWRWMRMLIRAKKLGRNANADSARMPTRRVLERRPTTRRCSQLLTRLKPPKTKTER